MQISFLAASRGNLAALSCSSLAALSYSNLAAHCLRLLCGLFVVVFLWVEYGIKIAN